MKSEVEINKENIRCGDVLYYSDNDNCQSWIVIGIENNLSGLHLISTDTQSEDYFPFHELQIGWEISERTKEYNRVNYRVEYLTT